TAYVQRGAEGRAAACRAQWLSLSDSGAARAKLDCLDDRAASARALIDLLSRADRSLVARVPEAVAALPSLGSCDDGSALPPPEGAQVRAQVDSLRSKLAEVRALLGAGRWRDGLHEIDPVRTGARALGYGPFLAEVLLLDGDLHASAGDLAAA